MFVHFFLEIDRIIPVLEDTASAELGEIRPDSRVTQWPYGHRGFIPH